MKPGDTEVHRGLIWLVEKIELRGVDEHWAKLVIYEGKDRLVNVEWIEFNEGGRDNGSE